jgi:fumarate hydratase subunit beta
MILVELETPLGAEEIRALRAGDRLSLSGTAFTMRDQATRRLVEMSRRGEELPAGLEGSVVYHAGPSLDLSVDPPRVASIGPTTSARMNSIMGELIRRLGIRLVVGKGGMDESVHRAMIQTGCAYASAIGGCAALYTGSVQALTRVIWEEMGPEAIHELQLRGMKPLVVTMDCHGRSLHAEREEAAGARLSELVQPRAEGQI